MLEFPIIQSRGFRNIRQGDQVTGFQVPIRMKSYRGMWLPQLRPATVTVDGVKFDGDQVAWVVSGTTVEQRELPKRDDIHWSSLEPAFLVVKKPGGLESGVHEVDVSFKYSASYLPPRIDLQEGGGEPRTLVMV